MVNKAIILGNLGADPEVKSTNNGTAVANFTVATTEWWKDQSGQQQKKTEWHRVVAWNRLAEIIGEYMHKGSKVYIEGALKTRKWEKDGVTHYTTEIIAKTVQFLDGKKEVDSGNQGGYGGQEQDSWQHGGGSSVPF